VLETELVPDMPTGSVSSIDALYDLQSSNDITDVSTSLAILQNGIEYTFVEVTCSDGIQYGTQAYENEALALNKAAHKIDPHEQELSAMLILFVER
jgi:hypothetical protein